MKEFKTDWNEAKKQFQKNWSALKPEDLERTHADKDALAKLIENKYGLPHVQAAAAVSEIMQDIEHPQDLPETEQDKKIEEDVPVPYPNKLYEEELPPEIQLDENDY